MKLIKQTLSLLLVFIFVISIFTPAYAAPLTDTGVEIILSKKATDCVNFDINVRYHQDEARQMLDLVNNLRKEKGLNELVYDYELETFSMLRAAECGVYYNSTHRAPSGLGGTMELQILYKDNPTCNCENLTTLTNTMVNAFNNWLNSGGHREAMLSKDATRISVGCAEFESGQKAWIMNLTSDDFVAKSDIETLTDEDWQKVTIESSASHIESLTPEKIGLVYGETYCIDDLSFNAIYKIYDDINHDGSPLKLQGLSSGYKLYPQNVEWAIADENVANIIDGKIVPIGVGSTTIETNFAGFDIAIPLTVNPIDISNGKLVLTSKTVSFNDYVNNGISLEPDVQVSLNGEVISTKNYNVSYDTNNDKPGKAAVTVKGTGVYSGTITENYDIVCEHNYKSVITPSSCTAEGYTTNTCSVCGDIYKSNPTGKLPHTLEETKSVPPTCTEDGYIIKECIYCDYSETITAEIDESLKAKGHTEVNYAAIVPTCTTDGRTEGTMCSKCKEILSGLETVNALGHILVTELTSNGTVQTTYCIRGYDGYAEIPKSEYISSESQYKDFFDMKAYPYINNEITALKLTFSADTTGTITLYNSSMSKTYAQGNLAGKTIEIDDNCFLLLASQNAKFSFDSMEAKFSGSCDYRETIELDHNYTSEITKPATCTEEGLETFTCINCNDSYTSVLPKTDHIVGNTEDVIITEASCMESGLKEVTSYCKDCNAEIGTEEIVIPAFNHKYIITDSKNATCTEEGYKTYKCSNCNDTYTETIPMTDHTVVIDKAISANCNQTGLTEGSHCSVCNKIIKEQSVIPGTVHIYDNGKITTTATCAATGVKTYTCKNCGTTKTEAVSKTKHTEKSTTTKATTSKDGKIVKSCSVCKATISTTVIPKASSVKLSSTSIVYNGKVQTPTVTVKDSKGTTLKNNTDYTVSYASGRKNVGRYSVKITFKGNYSGTSTQYFNITPAVPKISKVIINSTSAFTATWNKISCTGYQLQYATKSDFSDAKSVTVKGNSNVSKKITGLKKNKKYYIRVRCYTTTKFNGSNYNVYSSWSPTKSPWMTTATTTLSYTSKAYNGKVQTPSVTVKDSNGKTLKKDTDYTVSYSSGRKNVGRYSIKITYKGNYGCIPAQTLYYNIVPKATTLKSVSAQSKGFTVNWNKQATQTTGYQIQYSTKSNFSNAATVWVAGNKNTSKKITGRAGNTKYYVRVRTYKTVKFNGKDYNVFSSWSSVKTVTTKK